MPKNFLLHWNKSRRK